MGRRVKELPPFLGIGEPPRSHLPLCWVWPFGTRPPFGQVGIQLLIAIAKFDIDGDGRIDEKEFAISRAQGERAVANAVQACTNFAIISALLFGASHNTNIGRPKPYEAGHDEHKEETLILMWVLYGLNVIAEALALSTIICSIFIRQLVSNALPSVGRPRACPGPVLAPAPGPTPLTDPRSLAQQVISRLVFLSDTNILSNMATSSTWMIACVVWIAALGTAASHTSGPQGATALRWPYAGLGSIPWPSLPHAGGFPAVPTYGLLSAAVFPVLVLLVIPQIYPAFLKSAIRLHLEAEAILRNKSRSDSPEATALHKARAKRDKNVRNNNKNNDKNEHGHNHDSLDASVADVGPEDF